MNTNLELIKYLLFATFIIILLYTTFGFLSKLNLEHGITFINLTDEYTIDTINTFDTNIKNTFFINVIPNECDSEIKKKSIKCLSSIKNNSGYVNGLYFRSGN